MLYLCTRKSGTPPDKHTKKEFFERFTQTEVVQEARAEMLLGKMNKPFNFLKLDSRSETDNDQIYKASRSERNESLLSISERRRRLVNFYRRYKFTMKSLILAQDERQLQA